MFVVSSVAVTATASVADVRSVLRDGRLASLTLERPGCHPDIVQPGMYCFQYLVTPLPSLC